MTHVLYNVYYLFASMLYLLSDHLCKGCRAKKNIYKKKQYCIEHAGDGYLQGYDRIVIIENNAIKRYYWSL